ncbi:MAG: hypothetical protein JNL79_35200 [Myxococcales bacterium]|nr:hypothetical protein [Myxococcales bacterium]
MRVLLSLLLAMGCGAESSSAAPADSEVSEAAFDATQEDASVDVSTDSDAPSDTPGDTARSPIKVDPTSPKRYDFTFKASEADPTATTSLGVQGAYVDTRVPPKGKLIVYLHGASDAALTNCTQGELANVVTAWGFHLLTPCYNSYYGVAACKDDIGGCRLEAFDGIDHTPYVAIGPADAIEPRVIAALQYLQKKHPGGDWAWFLEGGKPRWSDIVIAGISHGASSAALIAVYRRVDRAVSLSGPYDVKQAWLSKTPLTSLDRFWGFTHTGDAQHAGHLDAFAALELPGAPTTVDGATSPFGGSHRLVSSAPTTNGHSSTAPGSVSPKAGGAYVFLPVWKLMFGG